MKIRVSKTIISLKPIGNEPHFSCVVDSKFGVKAKKIQSNRLAVFLYPHKVGNCRFWFSFLFISSSGNRLSACTWHFQSELHMLGPAPRFLFIDVYCALPSKVVGPDLNLLK